MAYDVARQQVILFGGAIPGPAGVMNDTWTWDGKNWTQLFPKTSPTPRWGAMMVHDSARGRIVLHGGGVGLVGYNDTWEWDGKTWTQLFPAKSPAIYGSGYAMVYDAARRTIVMFGSAGWYPRSTWEWDEKTWVLRLPKTKPESRLFPGMAYDVARGRSVLFGGHWGTTFLNDVWEWDGLNWVKQTASVKPHTRATHSLVYDSVRARSVLFGGYDNGTPFDDTWEWDGRTWARQGTASSPPARGYHGAAYDSARRRVVVFGGTSKAGYRNDTWEYSAPHLLLTGTPRPGSTVTFAIDAAGNAGRFYQLGSSLGVGPIPIDSRFLDLAPDHLLVASTSGNLPWIFSGYRGAIDSGGKASAALNIPNLPALVGTRIHSAFVTLDAKAPSGIWAISNAATFTIR